MAKEVMVLIKLQCPGGQATPAPPVGPALGQHGVNIGEFVKRFNDRTKDQPGMVLPVVITVFKDKSFDFQVKSPPASVLLKKAAQLAKGAVNPGRETAGKAVDSSASVTACGRSLPTTSFMRLRKAIASRFSRPPCTLGTHSPAGRL